MPLSPDKSDQPLLELLRQTGGLSIQELTERLNVTATAVRQRLDRLYAGGLVEKEEIRGASRGRPSHRYRLSEAGLRTLDGAMVQLGKIVWEELQTLDDPVVRNYLLGRISRRLAEHYARPSATLSTSEPGESGPLSDSTPAAVEAGSAKAARLEEVVAALREQQFPVNVERDPVTMLPILKINGCPYPELSGENHDICEVEAAMFSELLGSPVKLRHCRCDSPDGGCVFDVSRESLEAGETTSNAAPGTLDTSQLSTAQLSTSQLSTSQLSTSQLGTSQLGTAHMDHTHSGTNHQQASGNLENCTSN